MRYESDLDRQAACRQTTCSVFSQLTGRCGPIGKGSEEPCVQLESARAKTSKRTRLFCVVDRPIPPATFHRHLHLTLKYAVVDSRRSSPLPPAHTDELPQAASLVIAIEC